MDNGRAAAQAAASGRPRRLGAIRRLSTRHRLAVAFVAVVAASISVMVLQIVTLRRMETTFAEMAEHEEQLRLALDLEDAVRAQYAQERRLVFGESTRLDLYEEERARVVERIAVLASRVDVADGIAWVSEIGVASEELDRMFREHIEPVMGYRRHPQAVLAHERNYPLVAAIETNADRLFARFQQEISGFRADLVAKEKAAVRWTAIVLVVVPLFVAAVFLYLVRFVAKPLARLGEGTAAIARGDLGVRIDIDTPDEFGALAAEFNAMTVALKEHQERLLESEKLAGIGRLAAGIAHELNNPLQVMLGYLSLHRDVRDRKLAEHLLAVEEEVLRCRNVIDDLLELARPAVRPVEVDLQGLCEDVAESLRVAAQREVPRLSVEGAARAVGDPLKLRQAVFNLMKNAMEAAGPAGKVDVQVASSTAHAEIAVCDSGPGLAPEARANLFEPFFTTKPLGTGLGLAVSRAIALAHGGDIHVKNGDRGGAVFTLRLPGIQEARSLS